MSVDIRGIIGVVGIVLIWGLGCYGAIKISHSPPGTTIFASVFIMLFLFAFLGVGKMYWDISQERKKIEEKCLTDNDPKTFLEAIRFYSTLNYRDNARTNIPRAKEIGKQFVEKILSGGKDFLNDQQMIETIALLAGLNMKEEALRCFQHYCNRKT